MSKKTGLADQALPTRKQAAGGEAWLKQLESHGAEAEESPAPTPPPPPMTKMTFTLPVELHRWLKGWCGQQGFKMHEEIVRALERLRVEQEAAQKENGKTG